MKSFIYISFFLCLVFISVLILSGEKKMHASGEFEGKFKKHITKTVGYQYHLYIPDKLDAGYGYPLLLFLHGAGERGEDLELVKMHGINNMLKVHDPFPFIVLSPQVPYGEWWDSETLNALIDHAIENYPIDIERIYVTGLSMGGYGTWDLITKYPDRFAAAIPICGGGNRLLINRAKNIPVWAFHGDADPVIPLDRSVEMVEALNNAGGTAKLTVYPGVGHDAWSPTYTNEEIYNWLLQFKRKK